MSDIAQRLKEKGFSSDASRLFMQSWRPATQAAYNVYINKWKVYCASHGVDPLQPSTTHVCNFLAHLFHEGASYSTINTARSALSSFVPSEIPLGTNSDVCRLVKGVFEERPALPKHSEIWDVGIVLKYLASQPSIIKMTLKQLTLRTVMLLSLVTGQRGHALYQLKTSDVKFSNNLSKCTIAYSSLHKHSRPGVHTAPSDIQAFHENSNLCPVQHLHGYIQRTKDLRHAQSHALFISFSKPHGSVTRMTFSRWVKATLAAAGIDCTQFSSHSTRAASVSAATEAGVPVETVLKAAGWSGDGTFIRFYRRRVSANFGQSVLDNFVTKK